MSSYRFNFLTKSPSAFIETVTFSLGNREEGDRLVVAEEIKESKHFMKKVSVLRAFSTLNPNARITYLEAASLTPGNKCPKQNQAEIKVDGGPGKDHAVIKIKSKRHLKIHYKISIYAIGAWTIAEMDEEKRRKSMEPMNQAESKCVDGNIDFRRRGYMSWCINSDLDQMIKLEERKSRRLSVAGFIVTPEELQELAEIERCKQKSNQFKMVTEV